MRGRCSKLLLDVERVEVDDGRDEVVAHEQLSQLRPLAVALSQQRADRLHRHLDGGRRVRQTTNFLQVLAFDRFNGYTSSTTNSFTK